MQLLQRSWCWNNEGELSILRFWSWHRYSMKHLRCINTYVLIICTWIQCLSQHTVIVQNAISIYIYIIIAKQTKFWLFDVSLSNLLIYTLIQFHNLYFHKYIHIVTIQISLSSPLSNSKKKNKKFTIYLSLYFTIIS